MCVFTINSEVRGCLDRDAVLEWRQGTPGLNILELHGTCKQCRQILGLPCQLVLQVVPARPSKNAKCDTFKSFKVRRKVASVFPSCGQRISTELQRLQRGCEIVTIV